MTPARWTKRAFLAAFVLVWPARHASATWSICIADSNTKEVAVGTVTCLLSFDLLALVPVVLTGKGAAACQASGDFDGLRRPVIYNQLKLGTAPQQILVILSGITGHQSRQYGIVDTQGRMITFSGSQTLQWSGGVTGSQGTMVYAIQGNILAGPCVVPAIQQALVNTVGDVPDKLMAAMEAARDTGGDGRCSCLTGGPTSCGCPVPDFDKSGHIGGMIVARHGDVDDPLCNAAGCTDGNYFMRLNVAFQDGPEPDPVTQLRAQFDAWRAALVGRPDAIRTLVTITPSTLPADGSSTATIRITPLDYRGLPVTVPIQSVFVFHSAASPGISLIGPVTQDIDGTYVATLTAGSVAGTDVFTVRLNDGLRPVNVMPEPRLTLTPPSVNIRPPPQLLQRTPSSGN